MIEQEKLGAVDIVTPVGSHAPLTRLAADAGLHVCCQKPLTPTVKEADELIAYVGERVRFMVHENYRFRPHYVRVKQWLDDGRVGEFVHGIRSGNPFPTDRLDNLETLRPMESCYIAAGVKF